MSRGYISWTLFRFARRSRGHCERASTKYSPRRTTLIGQERTFLSRRFGLLRTSDAFFSLKQGMSGALANPFQSGNVIPERDQCDPHTSILQSGTQVCDLSTLPAPSMPKNLQIYRTCYRALSASLSSYKSFEMMLLFSSPYGRLGLPADSATTVPTATQAPTIRPTRMRNERDLFCFAGAVRLRPVLRCNACRFFIRSGGRAHWIRRAILLLLRSRRQRGRGLFLIDVARACRVGTAGSGLWLRRGCRRITRHTIGALSIRGRRNGSLLTGGRRRDRCSGERRHQKKYQAACDLSLLPTS